MARGARYKTTMNKSPAFQFYASDFLADVAAWTAEEVGVYMRLLASEWVNDYVPKALNRLAFVAGVSVAQLRRVWPQVGKKFELGEGGNLQNPRLEWERKKQEDYRIRRSLAGTAGAQKRWNSHRYPSDGKANSSTTVLPIASGMTNDSSSSSFSSSFASVNEKQVPSAYSATEDSGGCVWETPEEHETRVMKEYEDRMLMRPRKRSGRKRA